MLFGILKYVRDIVDGSAICVTKCVRDLGVLVDSELKFMEHMNSITSRGYARANLILKCFISRDCGTLLRSFTTYLRPLLEYASQFGRQAPRVQ